MNILDLNQFEVVEGNEVVGGSSVFVPFPFGGFGSRANFSQTVFTNVNQNNDQKSGVVSVGAAKGNVALGDSQSTATGDDTFTSSTVFTDTTSFSSASKALGTSVTN